jgi:hypothetical protein
MQSMATLSFGLPPLQPGIHNAPDIAASGDIRISRMDGFDGGRE